MKSNGKNNIILWILYDVWYREVEFEFCDGAIKLHTKLLSSELTGQGLIECTDSVMVKRYRKAVKYRFEV